MERSPATYAERTYRETMFDSEDAIIEGILRLITEERSIGRCLRPRR